MTIFDKFCEVSTVHQAVIQFTWTADRLHDVDYHIRFYDNIEHIIKEIEENYDVTNDSRSCFQWEGFLFYGRNIHQLNAAAAWLVEEICKYDVKSLSND